MHEPCKLTSCVQSRPVDGTGSSKHDFKPNRGLTFSEAVLISLYTRVNVSTNDLDYSEFLNPIKIEKQLLHLYICSLMILIFWLIRTSINNSKFEFWILAQVRIKGVKKRKDWTFEVPQFSTNYGKFIFHTVTERVPLESVVRTIHAIIVIVSNGPKDQPRIRELYDTI